MMPRKPTPANRTTKGRTHEAAKAAHASEPAVGSGNGTGSPAPAPAKARVKIPTGPMDPDPQDWARKTGMKTTADIDVPTRLIDQIIGQEDAVGVALKAAEQRRHLLLIGEPGTGKSMLAKAMAEVLPQYEPKDLLVFGNAKNPNEPFVQEYEGGKGRASVEQVEAKAQKNQKLWRVFDYLLVGGLLGVGLFLWLFRDEGPLVFFFVVLLALVYMYFSYSRKTKTEAVVPKLLIEHPGTTQMAPYVDATGSHAGALLGDVRHDPFQAGGLETPQHQRVEVGAIHRAHMGVLFIDEINVLRLPSQQALLTALQEGKYSIVGQSQSSAGAMVRTTPVPCNFILVAAGNLDAVQTPDQSLTGETGMHPALRSRIRGYGYEVYVNHVMDDNHANRMKLLQFVAQEVERDGRVPHLDAAAAAEIIREAQRRSGETGKLTLRLRELGGLVRTAGDFASSAGSKVVTLEHVRQAKAASRSLEQQIAAQKIRRRLSSLNLSTEGTAVGQANGSASVGTGEVGEPAGLVVPVEAAVVPALSRSGGALILGAGIQAVAHGGIENVGALLKMIKGTEIANHDIHLDAHLNHPDADATGIGAAAAVAAISALELAPVKQEYVMIARVAVNGELRPVDATLQQVESAMRLGYRYAIVPDLIRQTLLLDEFIREKIQVLFCRSLAEVLDQVLDLPTARRRALVERAKTPTVLLPNGGQKRAVQEVATK